MLTLMCVVLVACGGGQKPSEPEPVVRMGGEPDPMATFGDSPDKPAPVKSHQLPVYGDTSYTMPDGVTSADLDFCVAETNRYRSRVARPELRRAPPLQACAFAAARADHRDNRAHAYFLRSNGCNRAAAENQALRCPLTGTVQATIQRALQQMWAEGNGGAQHDAIAGGYSELGCGIELTGKTITIVLHFR